jgi:23S rRNA (adenine2503-C2)-methyltransferase
MNGPLPPSAPAAPLAPAASGAPAAPVALSQRPRPGVYDLSPEELSRILDGEPAYRARQVWDGLYRRCARPSEMTDLPRALRDRLEQALVPGLVEVARRTADDGATVKWLWALADGREVESVLMAYPDRVTVCVSTQAGCAMGCTFCATGQAGYQRHLTPGEIVEQVVAATRAARPRRLTNVVFMGMGEPLANYDRVWAAVERIHADLGLSARHLTLSTVGIVPGIRRLATAPLPVNLALSLHAANDELRDQLVPVNRRYPLAALTEACRHYVQASGRRLSVEWALIDGTNDRPADMDELAAFVRPLGAHVNLIPLNPTPGYPVRGTPRRRVVAARDELIALGVNATIRTTRGVEIDAACGQLAATARRRDRGATA